MTTQTQNERREPISEMSFALAKRIIPVWRKLAPGGGK